MVFLFVCLAIILLFVTSKIQIKIDNFKLLFSSENVKKIKLNEDYDIKIAFLIFCKLPILWININKNKIKKIKENGRYFKGIRQDISLKHLKQIKNKINICVKKFYLKSSIGTDNTIFTTMIIPLISSAIAIILARKKVKQKNQNFQINPIYNSRKCIKSGIFGYI